MDAIDGRLIARLMQEPLAPMKALCDVTGLTRNAVRARLERLRGEGILVGFNAMPNAALFGRTGIVAVFPPPAVANPPLEAVLAVEEVVSVSTNHDNVLAAIVYVEDGKIPEALVRVMGGPPARTFVQRSAPLRPPGAVLSGPQWRVLEALISKPRASLREVSLETGLTAKVIRRHRATLFEGGFAQVQALILSARSNGTTLFEIYVQGPAAREPAAITRSLQPSWIIDRLDEPVGVLLLAMAENVGDAVAAVNKARAIEGVDHAELIFGHDHLWARERIEGWCRAKRDARPAR